MDIATEEIWDRATLEIESLRAKVTRLTEALEEVCGQGTLNDAFVVAYEALLKEQEHSS